MCTHSVIPHADVCVNVVSIVFSSPVCVLRMYRHYYNYAADCWDVTTYPRPRFASEFGVQSYPSFLTLKPVSNGSLGDWASIDSAFMQHRQHHPDGNQQMLDQMKLHFMGASQSRVSSCHAWSRRTNEERT